MCARPTIFVSAVSSEFRSFRQAVCNVLLSKGIFPLVQEGFATEPYGEVRAILERKIRESDAVICLVGFGYGCEPKNRPEGQPRRSYTQLEYDIAREMGKPVYVFLSDEDARPCDEAPDEGEEERQLQAEHRKAVSGGDDLWHSFASREQLDTLVAKIPMVATSDLKISSGRLRHGAEHLFGREEEMARLDAAWDDPRTHVVSVVAWGGVGKTSLVAHWLGRMSADGWRGARRVFDWTFYSQGTREQGGASADQFVNAALEFFGDPDPTASSPWDKGARLARLVAASRTLLVLDGLEPLQHPPGPVGGKLKDPALEALLKGLAHQNPGLCILTTREGVRDLAPFYETTVQKWVLEHLSEEAGAALFRQAGVDGTEAELRQASREVRGHALTLNLLGSYLALAHGGDIRKRDVVALDEADAETQGGHAFRVMAAYEAWLAGGGESGARELTVLRLLGLFDRPADPGCLAALRREPAIAGLTEPLIGLSAARWAITVKRLEECRLLSVREPEGTGGEEGAVLDAHPLVREYFGGQLREQSPAAWREAHRRLYEHLQKGAELWPDTLAGLQPLYQAIVHGCQAGLHQEACVGVYWQRIQRGNEFYSTKKLGAVGSDLGAVACFFEEPWSRLAPSLTEAAQAWLLNQAAFRLRALGRLTEALEPMRAGLERPLRDEDWKRAAAGASNLSELELTLGRVADAVRDAEQGVDFADRSADAPERMTDRAALADALHQAGRREEARERFREAEAMQAEHQPSYRVLYSVQGFEYCDLLLAEAERAAWRQAIGSGAGEGHGQDARATVMESCREVEQRAAQALKWAGEAPEASLLDIAVNHLTLGRAALYRAILDHPALRIPHSVLRDAHQQVAAAVDGLRASGNQDQVPCGLVSRAWLRFVDGDEAGAGADLEEAWEIAERGPMRLYMADVLLHRARLFRDREALAEARKLIEECGYHRRDEELRDAEAAMGR